MAFANIALEILTKQKSVNPTSHFKVNLAQKTILSVSPKLVTPVRAKATASAQKAVRLAHPATPITNHRNVDIVSTVTLYRILIKSALPVMMAIPRPWTTSVSPTEIARAFPILAMTTTAVSAHDAKMVNAFSTSSCLIVGSVTSVLKILWDAFSLEVLAMMEIQIRNLIHVIRTMENVKERNAR